MFGELGQTSHSARTSATSSCVLPSTHTLKGDTASLSLFFIFTSSLSVLNLSQTSFHFLFLFFFQKCFLDSYLMILSFKSILEHRHLLVLCVKHWHLQMHFDSTHFWPLYFLFVLIGIFCLFVCLKGVIVKHWLISGQNEPPVTQQLLDVDIMNLFTLSTPTVLDFVTMTKMFALCLCVVFLYLILKSIVWYPSSLFFLKITFIRTAVESLAVPSTVVWTTSKQWQLHNS